jgi:hypothetical protein
LTRWWTSPFPSYVFWNWLGEADGEELPFLLHRDKEGRVWAPNLPLHLVKTNGVP